MPKKNPVHGFLWVFWFFCLSELPVPPSLGGHTGNQNSFLQEQGEDSVAQALLSLPLGWGIGFNNLCMKAAGSLLETSMGKGLGILMSDKLEAPCRITWGRTGNLLIQANLPT